VYKKLKKILKSDYPQPYAQKSKISGTQKILKEFFSEWWGFTPLFQDGFLENEI